MCVYITEKTFAHTERVLHCLHNFCRFYSLFLKYIYVSSSSSSFCFRNISGKFLFLFYFLIVRKTNQTIFPDGFCFVALDRSFEELILNTK